MQASPRQRSAQISKKSTVRLYQDGSATKTTVGDNGILYVSGDSRAEETHVTKGGKLIVYSESQGPTLKKHSNRGNINLKKVMSHWKVKRNLSLAQP